mgnify:CR=1 FL=1
MRFGRTVPIDKGFLPAFSVNTEAEARDLLILTCPTNINGEYIAPELAEEQTLDNLYAFGERLKRGYAMLNARRELRK